LSALNLLVIAGAGQLIVEKRPLPFIVVNPVMFIKK